MKFQISFDIPDLQKSLEIGSQITDYASSLEIGSILIFKHGITAVEQFRQAFPDKTILVDSKILDRAKEATNLFCNAGANWITVMAGTSKSVIHSAGTTAHANNAKVMLDLLDSSSVGQSALEAQSLEVDALLLHTPFDEGESLLFLDEWDMVRGNTSLPIYVSGHITKNIIDKILEIKPDGIIIGKEIIESDNPAEAAKFFYDKIHNNPEPTTPE